MSDLIVLTPENVDNALPDLPRIEGHGVHPTIEVQPCRVHCKGKDPQWEKVVESIKAQRAPP
jgi:C-terminal processing protease CtpA/Prc